MYKISNKDIYFRQISKDKLVIFLHGYRGNKYELEFLRDFILKKMRLSYLSFNYGERNNKNEVINIKNASNEAEEALGKFLSKHSFKQVFLIGYSLGSGVAVMVACQKSIKFGGIILISIFDNLKQLLAQRGIELAEKDNICPAKIVKNIEIPIIFIHGNKDTSVPMKRGLTVYENSDKKKSLFIAINADHYFKDHKSRKELCESVKRSLSFILN